MGTLNPLPVRIVEISSHLISAAMLLRLHNKFEIYIYCEAAPFNCCTSVPLTPASLMVTLVDTDVTGQDFTELP